MAYSTVLQRKVGDSNRARQPPRVHPQELPSPSLEPCNRGRPPVPPPRHATGAAPAPRRRAARRSGPTRAERAAHDQLALARRGAREQQQRHVAAKEDEQQHREEVESSTQQQVRSAGSLNCFAYGPTCGCEVFVRVAANRSPRVAERRQLRLRALERRAGASRPKIVMAGPARGASSAARRPERHPQVVRDGKREAFGHHADDGRERVAELHASGRPRPGRSRSASAIHRSRARRPAARPALRPRRRARGPAAAVPEATRNAEAVISAT